MMRSLTLPELAAFLVGEGVAGQAVAIDGDEKVVTVHYRNIDVQMTSDRDGPDHEWWPRSLDVVLPAGWPKSLPTAVVPGDYLPLEDIPSLVGILRDLDEFASIAERAVHSVAGTA